LLREYVASRSWTLAGGEEPSAGAAARNAPAAGSKEDMRNRSVRRGTGERGCPCGKAGNPALRRRQRQNKAGFIQVQFSAPRWRQMRLRTVSAQPQASGAASRGRRPRRPKGRA
jgi:hypothetical protein